MKTINLGRQMNVWNDFKLLIENKLEKLDKYFAEEAEATVTLSKKRNLRNIEVTILAGGTIFRSEVAKEDFRCALDEALETIERQIRKNKTMLSKRLRDNAFAEVETFEPLDELEQEVIGITKVKKFYLTDMTPEDAVLQMNLLGHSFYMFRDITNNKVCVVYPRENGEYGLIVPEDE